MTGDDADRLSARLRVLTEIVSNVRWERFQEKDDEYDDSWKGCDRELLEERMDEEYASFKKYLAEGQGTKAIRELADLTNFALFLLARSAEGVDE